MSYQQLLCHRMEVRRKDGSVDRFGQPKKQNPSSDDSAPLATYPCRAYYKSGGRVSEERSFELFEERQMVHAMPGIDVREGDTLKVIDPATDTVVMEKGRVFHLDTMYAFGTPHHVEIIVEIQRGPVSA